MDAQQGWGGFDPQGAQISLGHRADLYVDGALQNGGEDQQRFVHFMLSERVRSSVDDGYTLGFDADVDLEGSLQRT